MKSILNPVIGTALSINAAYASSCGPQVDEVRYEGVPEKIGDGFISASSKGKYFNISIKNSYSYTKIK